MVRRIYVEKKPPLRQEASELLRELRTLLGITTLTGLRLLNRYDVEGLDEAAFRRAVNTVFPSPRWTTPRRLSPPGTSPPLPWSICPVSLTSGRTPPKPAFS